MEGQHRSLTPPPPMPAAVEKREVLRKELSALSPEELRFLVTHQLRWVGAVCA